MDIYRHTAVSTAVSTLLLIILKKVQISIACFLTGVLIDFDHIFDYYMNQELRGKFGYLRHPRKLLRFLSTEYSKSRPSDRVYKPLHSLELLIPLSLFYAFRIWSDVATGILIGFTLHLIMDALPLGCIGAVSMVYKVNRGFPRGADILEQRLSRIGRDMDRCQSCGVRGKIILHRHRSWYAGFTRRGLSKMMILCPKCHDRMHGEKG